MAAGKLTASRLREILSYSPTTGVLRWLQPPSNRVKLGDIAGSPHAQGYIQVNVLGSNWLAHRIAWLHFFGEFPEQQIDHRNGDRCDNRIFNMRDVPPIENMQNLRKPTIRNHSGYLGVSWSEKELTWVAQISVNNETQRIAASHDPRAAYDAYLTAKRQLHAGCTL